MSQVRRFERVAPLWVVVCVGLILGALSCRSRPTTVLLHIHAGPGVAGLEELRLSVFTEVGTVVQDRRLPEEGTADLPDDVVLYPKVSAGVVRILVRGMEGATVAAEGAVPVELDPGEQVEATVVLRKEALPDSDGDGVPDAIDNCPKTANPQQGPCAGPDAAVDGPATDGPVNDGPVSDGPKPDAPLIPDLPLPDFPKVECTTDKDCDDSDACTTEQCLKGMCKYALVKCPPSKPCEPVTCDPPKGCTATKKPDGTKCDDGKHCTDNDACSAGVCGGTALDCTPSSPQCQTGTCSESAKGCSFTNFKDGTKCDDKDSCTQGESCQGGKCVDPSKVEILTSGNVYNGTDRATVVDSKGHVHTVFYLTNGDLLKYGTDASGSWVFTDVDKPAAAGGDVGSYPALAIDGTDALHVAYTDSKNKQMIYAKKAAGAATWTKSTIGPGVGHTSIALGQGGAVHVSYMNADALWYASGSPGSWKTSQVDAVGASAGFDAAGVEGSIALDQDGKPHIASAWGDLSGGGAYYFGKELRHSTNASGSWVSESPAKASLGKVHGAFSTIAISQSGTIDIAHSASASLGGGFFLSTKSSGGSWSTQTLKNGLVGSFASILLDSKGKVHIAYRNYSGPGSLRHITDVSGSFVEQTVDSAGDLGRWTSIARAPSGRIHVTYKNDPTMQLKHAYFSACP